MFKSLSTFTEKIISFSLILVAFLVPLVFAPTTLNYFAPHKNLVLVALASVSLLVWVLKMAVQKKPHIVLTAATVPLLIMAIIFVISSFLKSPNIFQAFLGETGIILSLVVLLLVSTSTLKQPKMAWTLFRTLLISLSIASVMVIAQFFQLGKMTGISWLESQLLNPVGGPINYLSVSLPLFVAAVVYLWKTKRFSGWVIASAGLLAVGSGLSVFLIITQSLQLMPWVAAWVVAMGAMQNPLTALIGTGPGSFANIYNLLRPASVNLTPVGGIGFVSSANFYLHLLTTTGLISLALYIFAGVRTSLAGLRNGANNHLFTYASLLAASLITQLFLPPNVVSLTVVFLAMICIGLELKKTDHVVAGTEVTGMEKTSERYDLLYWFVAVLVILVLSYNGYLVGRAYASEFVFGASMTAAKENRGTDVYNLQSRAINLKPYEVQYRIAYAQTNMALVAALAEQKDAPEEVKNNITELIQQAIREGKVAVQLEPANTYAWQNLASIYQQLIGTVEGADQWAVDAYQQAITFDPSNPQLRLNLGGIFYAAKNYEQATQFFTQAVQLLPNWANAYYNLSMAYKESGKIPESYQAMKATVDLLNKDSEDYKKAKTELETLRLEVEKLKEQAEKSAAAEAAKRGVTPNPITTPTASPTVTPTTEPTASPSPKSEPNQETPLTQ